MGEHLWKKGERRCYNCLKILPLTSHYFVKRKREKLGFAYICKSCHNYLTSHTHRPYRFKTFSKYGFTCQYCGRRAPEVILEIDHIVPISKGGKNSPDNLTVACRACNAGKKDLLLAA